jgi:hypothetical protein
MNLKSFAHFNKVINMHSLRYRLILYLAHRQELVLYRLKYGEELVIEGGLVFFGQHVPLGHFSDDSFGDLCPSLRRLASEDESYDFLRDFAL